MQKNFPNIFCFVDKFNLSHLSKLHKNTNLIFRNYDYSYPLNNLLKLKSYCKKTNKKLYLSNNINLSVKLGLDGIYIPSFNTQINYCRNFNLPKNFKIIGSAHNISELKLKEKQGVELIFLSPLFITKNYKKSLGIVKFNMISLQTNKNIVALGGIRKNNINKLKMTNAVGYSGINIFLENE